MNRIKIITVLACTLFSQACTSEMVKRGVHDTLENIKQMDCAQARSRDCQERESYDEYQRKRQEVQKP